MSRKCYLHANSKTSCCPQRLKNRVNIAAIHFLYISATMLGEWEVKIFHRYIMDVLIDPATVAM